MFDVIGRAPRTEAGECFTINNAGWRELKDLCFHAAPDIRSQVGDRWNTNDGHGLDAAGALALADALESSFDSSAVCRVNGTLPTVKPFSAGC